MKKRISTVSLLIAVAVLMCGCSNSKAPALNRGFSHPVLIIDPGHGGADGGAVADDGTIESLINLNISLKLAALCGLFGYDHVLTRESETLDYPPEAQTVRAKKLADQRNRINLINSLADAVLVSIHQNIYSTPMPSGAQVFYAQGQSSMELAELLQAGFNLCLNSGSPRNASQISNDIYLLNKAQCTAVLIECGFMSNPVDLCHLKSEAHQKKIASAVIAAYIQFISETGSTYG